MLLRRQRRALLATKMRLRRRGTEMDAWSRKQRAKAEAKLGEAVAILEELWQEESKVFANRPVRWQRSEQRGGRTAAPLRFRQPHSRNIRCPRKPDTIKRQARHPADPDSRR